jgi:sphingolipid delta-4 desaturase
MASVTGKQTLTMYDLISDASWVTVVVLAYVLGGTINHSLTLAIHEIAHNLAFGHSYPLANRFLGYFANLPLGVPMSVSFKKYHLEHHRYQGDVEKDVDIAVTIYFVRGSCPISFFTSGYLAAKKKPIDKKI